MEELVIGRYRVTRKLGAGGMAEVYAAKHELMDRYAAVKLLLPEMSAREGIVKRFFQEAKAAARIDNPGIVHVYDVGYTSGGRAYLVMEMLSGETLYRRLKRQGRLSIEDTLTVIRQLAGVMAAAHQSGIIHRDLKPDNLFLVPDPEMLHGERVKVLDFGLAKLLEGSAMSSELTAQDAIFGTPGYMSPEQCQSAADVDGRADIYSIGCIFYACLCGRPPFGTGGVDVLVAHIGQKPTPPRQHVPALPPAIDTLILRLLEKDPGLRVQTCEELIAELDAAAALAGIPPGTNRPPTRTTSDNEATIREDPTLKGTVAMIGELEQGAWSDTAEGAGQSAPQPPKRASAVLPVAPAQPPGPPEPRAPLPQTKRLHVPLKLLATTRRLQPSQIQAAPVPPPTARRQTAVLPTIEATNEPGRNGRGSSPTISSGEVEQYPRSHTEVGLRTGRKNSALWSLAVVGFFGGLLVTGFVLAEDGNDVTLLPSDSEQTPGQVPIEPPATEEPAVEVAEASDHGAEIETLLSEAWQAMLARDWGTARKLLQQANQHPNIDTERKARVAKMAQQLKAEQEQHQKTFERLHAARSKRQMPRLVKAYASIPEHSVFRTEARALYEAARTEWLEQTRARMQVLLQNGECKTLAGVAASGARLFPELQQELEAQSATCKPLDEGEKAAGKSSARQVLSRVRADYKQGRTALAFERCHEAWEIVAGDEELTTLCGLAACKVKNRQAARQYHKKVSKPANRSAIVQICLTEGMNIQK
jgi:serine/threonine protein kinase